MQQDTSWTQIRDAAAGDPTRRDAFVTRYAPAVRAYFEARWPTPAARVDLDDAVQEVFVDCFRPGGALDRAEPGGPAGFRGYLQGVTRVVALRVEQRRRQRREHGSDGLDDVALDEPTLSRAFDRAWALQLAREAVRRNRERAEAAGDAAAQRRVEILRLRFTEGLPIRDVAPRVGLDAAHAHREYAKAREEFRKVLLEVVAEHTGRPHELRRECLELLALLE